MRAAGSAALETETDDPRATSGELALIAAVLQRAVLDARAGRQDARQWLTSSERGPAERGWYFLDLCDHLQVDPGWGRAQIARGGQSRRPSMRRPRRLKAA